MSKNGVAIVVTSGKGGVAKTTTSASVATGLAKEGYNVCVVDFDIGLSNLDSVMGLEKRVVYDCVNVMNGVATIEKALVQDKKIANLYMLAASSTEDKDVLVEEKVGKLISDLKERFDFVILDSPAGIERGAVASLYHADKAIVVANPEINSIKDADRIIGYLDSKSKKAESGERMEKCMLLTRYNAEAVRRGTMLTVEDCVGILSLDLIGVIPEDQRFTVQCSNEGTPVILYPDTPVGGAYCDMVKRLLGQEVPFRFLEDKKQGFLGKLFGKGA